MTERAATLNQLVNRVNRWGSTNDSEQASGENDRGLDPHTTTRANSDTQDDMIHVNFSLSSQTLLQRMWHSLIEQSDGNKVNEIWERGSGCRRNKRGQQVPYFNSGTQDQVQSDLAKTLALPENSDNQLTSFMSWICYLNYFTILSSKHRSTKSDLRSQTCWQIPPFFAATNFHAIRLAFDPHR